MVWNFQLKNFLTMVAFLCIFFVGVLALPNQSWSCTKCSSGDCCCGDGAVTAAAAAASTDSEIVASLKQWAKEFAEWAKQFSFLTTIISLYNDFNSFLDEGFSKLGSIFNAGQKLQVETKVRAAKGLADAQDQSTAAAALAQVVAPQIDLFPHYQANCNLIKGNMGIEGSVLWEKDLGTLIAKWIKDYGRGTLPSPSSVEVASGAEDQFLMPSGFKKVGAIQNRNEGEGQSMAAYAYMRRCGEQGGVKFAGPLSGYPSSCIQTNSKLADADINPAVWRKQPMEMPTLSTSLIAGVTQIIQILNNDRQKLFLGAEYYCAKIAAPRPAYKDLGAMDTETGHVDRMIFSNAGATESGFIRTCAEEVAYYTRPNCVNLDTASQSMCQHSQVVCKAYVANGGKLPPEMKSASGGCLNGLSPYEIDYLQAQQCAQSDVYLDAVIHGKSQGSAVASIAGCNYRIATFNSNMATRDYIFSKAVLGQLKNTSYSEYWPMSQNIKFNDVPSFRKLPKQREVKSSPGKTLVSASHYEMDPALKSFFEAAKLVDASQLQQH